MREQLISEIAECIYLANALENQLKDNAESFGRCVKGKIQDCYHVGNASAVEHCRELRTLLMQLQYEEQAKLQSGL